MCSQDTNIVINELDRALFTNQFTYEYCLKKGMSNKDWLAIKKMFKEGKYEPVNFLVKK